MTEDAPILPQDLVAKGSPFDGLLPSIYDELHRLAGAYMKKERRDHTLQPTALVNEVFLRMARQNGDIRVNPTRFKAVAALMIERILYDHARHKNALRRGGGFQCVPLEDDAKIGGEVEPDILALHEALRELARKNSRVARVVLMRYFAGLTVGETAEELEISERTVNDDWMFAKAWLARELEKGTTPA